MIYSLGEMLIDFMQEGSHYVPYPGGAPANVAAHARRRGADAVFVGKISTDTLGDLLHTTLKEHNILLPLPRSHKNTALALVSHKNGDRSFQFYRNDTADLSLSVKDIDTIVFKPADILHFCSLGLVAESTTRAAHHYAIQQCQNAGGIVSFDVNLRERLWPSLDAAYDAVMALVPHADIIKVNETELAWLTETQDVTIGMARLQTNKQLIICTLGAEGSEILKPNGERITYKPEIAQQVDTTGAGDSYIAMILASLSLSNVSFDTWLETHLEDAIAHASAVSAQVVQKQGAIPDINY
ncbi:carbohydrate kinase family protein [Erysipelothrix anatis]|uniref:carbohydrate kinase family protein n=1 Tax=Erysipelothrix anatis TaxID=2683713 RepID=UPI00135977D7|nr:carbohydrate kinase [Erysipelothrix anatis]